MEERIASMQTQLRTLKARHQKREVRRKREATQLTRKNELRRKLLVGAVILERVAQGEISEGQFLKWLDSALKEPADRKLFNLQVGEPLRASKSST
jgi:large subunit ribosomal protein L7/L12